MGVNIITSKFNGKIGLIESMETNYLKMLYYNLQPLSGDYKTYESSCLCVPLKGNKHVTVNRNANFTCDSDQFVLLPPHSCIHLEPPAKVLFFEFKDDLLNKVAENLSFDPTADYAPAKKKRYFVGHINDNIGDSFTKILNIAACSDKNRRYLFNLYAEELAYDLFQIKGTQQMINLGRSDPIYEAIRFINTNVMEQISTSELASALNMSDSNFCNTFKRATGVTPKEYINDLKMNRAEEMLQSKNVTEVAYDLGYESVSHFIALFKKKYGTTPKQYKSTGDVRL